MWRTRSSRFIFCCYTVTFYKFKTMLYIFRAHFLKEYLDEVEHKKILFPGVSTTASSFYLNPRFPLRYMGRTGGLSTRFRIWGKRNDFVQTNKEKAHTQAHNMRK
jgi:hypothetical protein